MPVAHVNGIEIYFDEAGSGDPVMLITGLGGVGRGWGKQIDRFATEFRTIVPDHRGAGQSSHPENGYTIQQLAADTAETLRSLDADPTHIIGSSTGGAIAQVMALDHQDVVRSITLVSSWATADDHFRHQFAVRKAILEDVGVPEYMEATALFLYSPAFFNDRYADVRSWIETATAGTTRPDILAKRIDMIVNFDETARLGQIAVPTLVLVGTADACTPPYHSEQLAELIPDAELETLPAGHLIAAEQPDRFHATVRSFIGR